MTEMRLDPGVLESLTAAELNDLISQLQAMETGIRAMKLQAMAAFDARKLWKDDGAPSMIDWTKQALGYTGRSGAEAMRVAHALEELPAIRGEYSAGRLSWDQVRPLTRFATPDTDALLASEAGGWSAAQVGFHARRRRPVTLEEVEQTRAKRSVRSWCDHEDRMHRMSSHLPDADGKFVDLVLNALARQAPPDPVTGILEPLRARRADALILMAKHVAATEGLLSASFSSSDDVACCPGESATSPNASEQDSKQARAPKPMLIIHADVDALLGTSSAHIQDGSAIGTDTLQRLACDGRIQLVAHATDGTPIGIGYTSRNIPWWLEAQVAHRDPHCAFPGCDRQIFMENHHMTPWPIGPTDLPNLRRFCWWHHVALHEGRIHVQEQPDGTLKILRRDGTEITAGPHAAKVDVHERLRAILFGEDHPSPRNRRTRPTRTRRTRTRPTRSRRTQRPTGREPPA